MAHGAERLSRECLEISAGGRLERIEQLARDAEELGKQKGDWLGCATTLLHVGDRCRQVGELAPAEEYCQQARRLFRQYNFTSGQLHNEAVATYALALVNQSSGNGRGALSLYEQAGEQLEQVQRTHWRKIGNGRLDGQCELVLWYINKLMEYVSDTLARENTMALQYSVFICPSPSDINRLRPLLAYLETEERTIAGKARIGDKDFELHPINGMTSPPALGQAYYVVEVPKHGVRGLRVQEGDYVLVKQVPEIPQADLAMRTEEEPLFCQFVRHSDGTLRLVPVGSDRAPQVMPDDLLTGMIVGSLKSTERAIAEKRELCERIEDQITGTYAIARVKNHQAGKPFYIGKAYILQTGVHSKMLEAFEHESGWFSSRRKAVRFEIVVHAEDMKIDPDWIQPYTFRSSEEPSFLEFRLKPIRLGRKQIRVGFLYQQHWLAEFQFEVEVLEGHYSG